MCGFASSATPELCSRRDLGLLLGGNYWVELLGGLKMVVWNGLWERKNEIKGSKGWEVGGVSMSSLHRGVTISADNL